MKVTQTLEVELSVEQLAALFSELDDDTMCKFFVEVARIMNGWGPGKCEHQLWYVGGHLKTCACSTEEARQWIKDLAGYIDTSTHSNA